MGDYLSYDAVAHSVLRIMHHDMERVDEALTWEALEVRRVKLSSDGVDR